MIPGAETAMVESFKWIWENFGKDITKDAGNSVKEKWKIFKHNKAAKKYTEKLKSLYGSIQIQ